MTPKEKAQEIYDKIHFALPSYHDEGQQEHAASKECALIAVDEIIESRKDDYEFDDSRYASPSSRNYNYYVPHPMHLTYWNQVKQEIEKL